jgi:hypothetical protein
MYFELLTTERFWLIEEIVADEKQGVGGHF